MLRPAFVFVILICGLGSGWAHGQARKQNPTKVLDERIQETDEDLQQLSEKIEQLRQEIDTLTRQIASYEAPASTPSAPAEKRAPREQKYRPPMERITSKSKAITLVFENNRVLLVDFDPVNVQVRRHLSGQHSADGQREGASTTSSGHFDVGFKYVREGGSYTLESLWLVSKPNASGESLAQFGRASSKVQQTLQRGDPDDTIITCIVFPDSYEAFLGVREVAWALGYELGWTAYAPDEKLILGGGGGGSRKVD